MDDPVAAVTADDALRRARAYPDLAAAGPVFGAAEEDADGWRIIDLHDGQPQMARDTLGAHFDHLARVEDDPGLAAEYEAAAERLDREVVNELVVGGRRYRIIRADRFVRTAQDQPEPPRPTDPDPYPAGQAYDAPYRTTGLLITSRPPACAVERMIREELLSLVYPASRVPPEVYADSSRALRTYPEGMLLPAEFIVAEQVAGGWRQATTVSATPQGARDALAFDFREVLPRMRRLTERERVAYARAADQLDLTRCDELEVLGRVFRVGRYEQIIRIGADGPELPRVSDHDPYPPPELRAYRLPRAE